MGWLDELLEVAREEARERGDDKLAPHHLALALTRDPATVELLRRLGRDTRVWRDYINFVLGMNVGANSERAGRVPTSHLVSAADLGHSGQVATTDRVEAILAAARRDAADDTAVGPPQVLSAIMASGAGAMASGTAQWLGLNAAVVRRAGGLSCRRRPLAPGVDWAGLPRPDARGPLVLLGGGPTPVEALRAVVDLADTPGEVQVAWVNAADPFLPDAAEGRRQQFAAASERVSVIDAGLRDSDTARDPAVVDVLVRSDVVFLEGGRVELLYATLAGSPALDALVSVSERGGVVVGYSAGAVVLGVGMLSDWHSWGEHPEPLRLLGWLPDTVVYAHASGAGELDRFRKTVAAFSGARGLGVAHGGAVVIAPSQTEPVLLARGWDTGCITIADGNAPTVQLAISEDEPSHP